MNINTQKTHKNITEKYIFVCLSPFMAEWVWCSLSTRETRVPSPLIPPRGKGSEGCISGDRIPILGVVRIPHKAVGPVAALLSRQIGNIKIEVDWIKKGAITSAKTVHKDLPNILDEFSNSDLFYKCTEMLNLFNLT